jgi:pimeloyl-ACP methyl ester carboxylesterase
MAGQGGARQASLVPPIVNCLEHDVSRPLLVALHGWLLAGRLWTPLADALAPDWELWAPDLPGFGQRVRPRGLHANLASYGRWLAQAAREQAGERPIV